MAINFATLKGLTIPEGAVKKITRNSDGAVLWEKFTGTPLGDLAVGTIVKTNVNGVSRNFIVVHQGIPSSAYDSSCDGTWLLMEDIYESMECGGLYAVSDIHSYLNDTFMELFDSDIKNAVKQVIIPYCTSDRNHTVMEGADGLSTKAFLMSLNEIGITPSKYYASLGAVLGYFNGADDARRIAMYNGSAYRWWLRTPFIRETTGAAVVTETGSHTDAKVFNPTWGVRPALVLPSDTVYVDGDNNIIV